MDSTILVYSFVGYLSRRLEPNIRKKLKESYHYTLNNSTSVAKWNYHPRKCRYEITIHQELLCFNFEKYTIDAVVDLLQQLIDTKLLDRNLVLVDGIYHKYLDVEYKLSLDELINFIKTVDRYYSKPQFLIMDSVREEILTKYKSWRLCEQLYNTLLIDPDVILPLIKEFVKSTRRWNWIRFYKFFRNNNAFGLETIMKEDKHLYAKAR